MTLPTLPDGFMDSMLKNHVQTAGQYFVCAVNHNSLVNAIRNQKGIITDDTAADMHGDGAATGLS
jgi:hypothetical protein